MLEEVANNAIKPEKLFGFRHVQMLMLFLGLALAYGMRVTMSIAIVVMVNDDQRARETALFDWSTIQQTSILSSFMIGYVISQVPGRRLAAKFGGKVLVVVGVAGSAVIATCISLGAYDGDWQLVTACRGLQGLAQGSMVPAALNLIDNWMPLNEKRLAEALVHCALMFGVFLEFLISGFIISAWGWTGAFYMNTVTGVSWSVLYMIFGSKSAETSKFISEEEKLYIRNSLKQDNDPKDLKTPWYALWTTLPFLSLLIANCGQNWGQWTLMTLLPMYLQQTQGLDIEKNGIISAMPYLGMFLMILPIRYISNLFIKKEYLSVTTTRKIFSGIGFFGPSIGLLTLSFFRFNSQITAIILTLVLVLNAAQYSGFMLAHGDMAPNFSRRMSRITNGFADLLSFFAPLTAGVMLEDQNHDSWGSVFNLSASMYVVCGVFYLVFGTSVRQQWNEPRTSTIYSNATRTGPKAGTSRN